jgi:hypothetical protein
VVLMASSTPIPVPSNFGWKQHRNDMRGTVFVMVTKGEWNGAGNLMELRDEAAQQATHWCHCNLRQDMWKLTRVDAVLALMVLDPDDAFAFKMQWC